MGYIGCPCHALPLPSTKCPPLIAMILFFALIMNCPRNFSLAVNGRQSFGENEWYKLCKKSEIS